MTVTPSKTAGHAWAAAPGGLDSPTIGLPTTQLAVLKIQPAWARDVTNTRSKVNMYIHYYYYLVAEFYSFSRHALRNTSNETLYKLINYY